LANSLGKRSSKKDDGVTKTSILPVRKRELGEGLEDSSGSKLNTMNRRVFGPVNHHGGNT